MAAFQFLEITLAFSAGAAELQHNVAFEARELPVFFSIITVLFFRFFGSHEPCHPFQPCSLVLHVQRRELSRHGGRGCMCVPFRLIVAHVRGVILQTYDDAVHPVDITLEWTLCDIQFCSHVPAPAPPTFLCASEFVHPSLGSSAEQGCARSRLKQRFRRTAAVAVV